MEEGILNSASSSGKSPSGDNSKPKEFHEDIGQGGRAYVDVGQRKRHTVYLDGRVFDIGDLSRLETEAAYLDALFPSVFQQVWKLLESGVRVYYLRTTRLLKTLRQQNNVEKSDENDVRILATVPTEYWKELKKEDLELRGLLHQYYLLADDIRRNKQWLLLMVNEEGKALAKERTSFLQKQRRTLARRILEIAKTTLPYDYVHGKLGIQGVSLATLLTYVDFSKTFRQLIVYAGFYDPAMRNGSFNRKVRRALSALAATAIKHKHERYHEVYCQYLQKLQSRNKALLRVQKRLFKDIWWILGRLGPDQLARSRERS